MDSPNVPRSPRAQGAPIVAPRITPEDASAALASALVPAPCTFGVSWFDGKKGTRTSTADHDWPTLAAELVARLALPREKDLGEALLPGVTDPDRTDRQASAIRSVSFAHIDHDGGATTLGEARTAFKARGIAALVYPSPSAPLGPVDLATRWRALVPLAAGTDGATYDLVGPVLRDVAVALFGPGIDRSTYHQGRLAFVHPRETVGPRPAAALVVVDGAALDVARLAHAATLAGWWAPAPAREARRAGVRDGAALGAVLRDAGYLQGAANANGWTAMRCPREAWHSSHGPVRRDTSTAFHEGTGACNCLHGHTLGPAHEQGPANTSTVLRWVHEDRPDLVGHIALARDAGQLGEVVADLAAVPYGETPRRVVHLAVIPEDTTDAAARASRDGVLVLYTPDVGAGKSRNSGAALAPLVRDVDLQPDEDAAAPLGSAGVSVKDRDALPAAVASQLGAGLPVRVHTPVHLVVAEDGAPACIHAAEAKRVYGAGGSARASLCPAVPGPGGAVAPCERLGACDARAAWVPWRLGPDGTPRAESWHRPPAGEAWVAVSTHATPAPLRKGAPLVVDEADEALVPTGYTLTAESILAALAWSEMLAPARLHDTAEPTAAPRILGRAISRAVHATPLESVAAVPAGARLAWCVAAVMADLAAVTPVALRDLARWAPGVAEGDSAEDVCTAAVRQWIAKGANAHAVSLRRHRVLPEGGAEALRAIARWGSGCHAHYVTAEGADPVVMLAWPSTVAAAAGSVLARGGGVLALDATGDPAIARAAVGPELVVHDPVRVSGGADVQRVLVHTTRAGRRQMAPKGGAIDWHEHLLPALLGALGALRAGWRDGAGVGDGIVFAARLPALVCGALAAAGVEADEVAVRAEVDRQCAAAKVNTAMRERVLAWALAADDAVRRVVDEFGSHGDVRWAYYGSTEARGSNAHQHRSWSVTLGDARPSGEAMRQELWSVLGREPTRHEVRTAMARRAAAAHEQAHGRLRALRREGERLVQVHVGSVPPLRWYALDVAPLVVSLAGAERIGRDPVAVAPPTVDDVVAVAGDAAAAPSPLAALDVHRAYAAGWSMAEVIRAVGADRDTVRAWWRGERAPTKARHVDALRALADGRSAMSTRLALRRLTDGRGWAVVWRGTTGAMGLVQLLGALDVRVSADDVERWTLVQSAELPPEVVGAVAAVLPELVRVFPPARPMPAVVASWPPAVAPGAAPLPPTVAEPSAALPPPRRARGAGPPRRPPLAVPGAPLRETG